VRQSGHGQIQTSDVPLSQAHLYADHWLTHVLCLGQGDDAHMSGTTHPLRFTAPPRGTKASGWTRWIRLEPSSTPWKNEFQRNASPVWRLLWSVLTWATCGLTDGSAGLMTYKRNEEGLSISVGRGQKRWMGPNVQGGRERKVWSSASWRQRHHLQH